MGMTDPIADMLTRIRNAGRAHHESVDIPWSRIKESIARVLVAEGYLHEVKKVKAKEAPGFGTRRNSTAAAERGPTTKPSTRFTPCPR